MHPEPQSTLRAFMEAMNRWETDAFSRLGRDNRPDDSELASAIQSEVESQLNEIFARYCTPKTRKQGRQNCLAMRSPPDYDPVRETVAEVVEKSARRVEIFTKTTRPFGHEMCYVLLKRGDRWLLDSRKIKYTDGWENYSL